jgi:hypothetical protein|tara:strand:- start:1235 stop:1546 length:312 start_codon:yes stop_codon:yes gene_type:complete
MYSPITLRRILQKTKAITRQPVRFNVDNRDRFIYPAIDYLIKKPAPNPIPLGRWCHPSSDVYKETCKQDVKAAMADMDNSHQHDDGFDIASHLAMYREAEKRD